MRTRILIAIVASFSLLAPATGQQQGKQDEVVRVTTNLVQVDVVVTEKDGKQVTDLRPEELEILEDNRKQAITSFSYITSDASRSTSTPSSRSENEKTSGISPASLSLEQMRRTMVIVIDDLGLSFESTISVREALKKFVGEQMQPDDRVAIIRTSKGVGTLQQFTSEKPKLLAAIDNIRWYAWDAEGSARSHPWIRNRIQTSPRASNSWKSSKKLVSLITPSVVSARSPSCCRDWLRFLGASQF